MTLGAVLVLFPSRAFRRAASRALSFDLQEHEVSAVLARAGNRRAALAAQRKRYAWGVAFIMHYFEWACALYETLRDLGWSAERAGSSIESVNWTIFAPVSRALFMASRLRSRNVTKRAGWIYDVTFRTIFARPYKRIVLPSSNGVAFDVVACPIAAFYRERGVPELTHYAACGLDHHMTRQWGVEFTRSATIGTGHPLCDFRLTDPAPARRADSFSRPKII